MIENLIKFAFLTEEEMFEAIASGALTAYDICYSKTTNQQYLIDGNLNPITIKSRIKTYPSLYEAEVSLRNDKTTYSGEIISINDGLQYTAYVVNINDGVIDIRPICATATVDYDYVTNIPIINIRGTAAEPIVITELDNGIYKAVGIIDNPDGTRTTTAVGNIIIVEDSFAKRISTNNVFDYNATNCDKYVTESSLATKGYVTMPEVAEKIESYDYVQKDYVEQYVKESCTLLVEHIVDETIENDQCTTSDINDLFK